MEFALHNPNEGTQLRVTEQKQEEGLLFAKVSLECQEQKCLESFSVSFSIPSVDAHSHWSPRTDPMRKLGPEWNKKLTRSSFASGMPLHSVISVGDQNRLCVACSDVKTPMSIGTGVREETAEIICKVSFFIQSVSPVKDYSAVLRIDLRDIPFYESIYQAVAWWEIQWGFAPGPVPEAARLPVNSLWYSFHQRLETRQILEECRLSKPYGMETVILDDGWQTDDNNRGYAYCGDWELATSKIPDMRALCDGIHALGMKLMLWYSVPYVGIHSKKYMEFKNMQLGFDQRRGVASLDPRYPAVRQYLISTYEDAVRKWDLDGLKLDFVSAFQLTEASIAADPARDRESLEEAIELLLREITERLQAIKPDILIEFRQPYVGPAMARYGNMLRVGDCPNDALCNRTGVLDLRLTSGRVPVHSDMLMWHPQEPAEAAALQIASVLFSVPQISVRLEKISPEQKEMLRYYLDFWIRNRHILLDGKLTMSAPQSFYSKASATLQQEQIAVLYTDTVLKKTAQKTTVVNCGPQRKIYLDGFDAALYRIVNCMGQQIQSGSLCELAALDVPCAGMVLIDG